MERPKGLRSSYRQPKKRLSKKSAAAKIAASKRKIAKRNSSNELQVDCNLPINESVSDSSEKKVTASERKLSAFVTANSNPNTENADYSHYTLVHYSVWQNLLKGLLCSNCHSASVQMQFREHFGYASKLVAKCEECGFICGSTYSSPRVDNIHSHRPAFQVNKRMVESFSSIGKGHSAMEQFSMCMGMNVMGSRTFTTHLNAVCANNNTVKKDVLELATNFVREAHKEIDTSLEGQEVIDISVSYDGTWHKRGHTSNYGVGIVIDVLTGVALDYVVLSKYCHMCENTANELDKNSPEYAIWHECHVSSGECQKNYFASSNAMEKDAAEIMWSRSVAERGFRYTTIVSDGDAKTHAHLNDIKVYGPNTLIAKEECVNHVSKRLGTALRNLVKEWKVKKVTLGGRKAGSLKESTIKRLTSYYRNAITDNVPDVSKMKSAIYATISHYMSTDDKPQHGKCPPGETSWCFYNRQRAQGKTPDSHTKMKVTLTPDVVIKLMPVYQKLASDALLQRCATGRTQNANESIHSVIWKKCPKEIFISKRKLELALVRSIAEFNMGCKKTIEVLHGIDVAKTTAEISQRRDKNRLRQSRKRSTLHERSTRKRTKIMKISSEEVKKKKEGPTYGAGLF